MSSQKRIEVKVKPPSPVESQPAAEPAQPVQHDASGMHPVTSIEAELEQMSGRPHRNAVLHWAAFVLSLVSLTIVILWLINPQTPVSRFWLWFDIGLCIFFVFEFVTRSGFRWRPAEYARSRFFDYIAIVPVLLLVNFDVVWLYTWVWLILVARVVRALDRILGDGFARRNFFALLNGFEEEITDRVMVRIIERLHADVTRGKFGQTLSQSMNNNKESVLRRIRAEHPQEGLGANLARITGLEGALARAEERVFDSVIEVLASPEIDQAIHDSLDSTFSVLKAELGEKTWKKNLGIRFNQWKA
jgi:hypothetical protein